MNKLIICLVAVFTFFKGNAQDDFISETDSIFFNEGVGLSYEIDPNQDKFIIDSIIVKVLDPLGRDISDTTKVSTSFIKKTGNFIHVLTKKKVARQHLLFQEGDTVSALNLRESERLLRQTLKIRDARVITHRTRKVNHYEITVLIQDQLPYNFGYANVNNNQLFSISNQNFLGYGHALEYQLGVSQTDNSIFHNIAFRDLSVGNSFIQARVNYSTAPINSVNRVQLSRPFVTGLLRYGGGIGYSKTVSDEFRFNEDSIVASYVSDYNEADVWAGRSFNLNKNRWSPFSNNLVIAARYTNTQQKIRNTVYTGDSVNILNKSGDRLLFRVGFEKRKYYIDNFIYRFIYSEDIPLGFHASITAGKNFNSKIENSLTFGSTLGFANKHKFGYYNIRLNISQSFSDNDFLQSTNSSARLLYLSPLLLDGKFKNRIFLNSVFQNISKDGYFDRFVLENEDGFLNINSDALTGITKTSFTLTNILYTPWKPLGFNIGFFGYAAVANLSALQTKLINKPWYQAYGIGVLLRNENLMINEIRFAFTFYPSFPESTFKVNPLWIYDLHIPDIQVGAPDIY